MGFLWSFKISQQHITIFLKFGIANRIEYRSQSNNAVVVTKYFWSDNRKFVNAEYFNSCNLNDLNYSTFQQIWLSTVILFFIRFHLGLQSAKFINISQLTFFLFRTVKYVFINFHSPRKQTRNSQPNLLPIKWFACSNLKFQLCPPNFRWGN